MLRTLLLLLSLGLMLTSLAQAIQTAPGVPALPLASMSATSDPSDAFEFARQAGNIAGIVQACSQDTALFLQRMDEAISLLAKTPEEQTLARILFQKIVQEARQMEQSHQPIPCSQALSEYQRLPILAPDYKTRVLAKLKSS